MIPFEQTQRDVAEVKKDLKELKALMLRNADAQPETDNPIPIKEVANLTGKTVPTLYSYVRRNEIPHHKKGNRLYFFKSEIIAWIKTGKQKTLKEIEKEADAYLSNKNKGL
jgi:excisionase family DNA binding protein